MPVLYFHRTTIEGYRDNVSDEEGLSSLREPGFSIKAPMLGLRCPWQDCLACHVRQPPHTNEPNGKPYEPNGKPYGIPKSATKGGILRS